MEMKGEHIQHKTVWRNGIYMEKGVREEDGRGWLCVLDRRQTVLLPTKVTSAWSSRPITSFLCLGISNSITGMLPSEFSANTVLARRVTVDKLNSCICKYLQVVRAQGQVQVQMLKFQGQSQGQAPDPQGQVQVQALTSLVPSGMKSGMRHREQTDRQSKQPSSSGDVSLRSSNLSIVRTVSCFRNSWAKDRGLWPRLLLTSNTGWRCAASVDAQRSTPLRCRADSTCPTRYSTHSLWPSIAAKCTATYTVRHHHRHPSSSFLVRIQQQVHNYICSYSVIRQRQHGFSKNNSIEHCM